MLQEQLKQRSFVPEKCWSIACSSDGRLCAAGGESGKIHVWDTSSGKLMQSWPAHHKRVNTIAFNDMGTELVSGGEDSMVAVWSLPQILGGQEEPQPLHLWSDHTLPVSQVLVGSGFSDPYVYIASLDHSVSVRSLISGKLLKALALPAGLLCGAVDASEHAAYFGALDGNIYEVSFVEDSDQDVEAKPSSSRTTLSTEASAHNRIHKMVGHSGSVTSISLSSNGSRIVSGSEDGTVMIWDAITRQQIRKMTAGPPVSCVMVLNYPLAMAGRGKAKGQESQVRVYPLGSFGKVVGSSGTILKPWEDTVVLLDGVEPSHDEPCMLPASTSKGANVYPHIIHNNVPGNHQNEENSDREGLLTRIRTLEQERDRALALVQKFGKS